MDKFDDDGDYDLPSVDQLLALPTQNEPIVLSDDEKSESAQFDADYSDLELGCIGEPDSDSPRQSDDGIDILTPAIP